PSLLLIQLHDGEQLLRPLKKVQLRGGAREPHARRTPCYVPLGGGLRPPSETSPQDSLRRQSRRSEAEHFRVGRRATDEDLHGRPLTVPLRARASPAQPTPGGGFGGGRRGPLRWNEADGPFSAASGHEH